MIERLYPWIAKPHYCKVITDIINLSRPIENEVEEIFSETRGKLSGSNNTFFSVKNSDLSFYEATRKLDDKTRKMVLRSFMNKMDLIETQDDKKQLQNEASHLQDEALKKIDLSFDWVLEHVKKEKKLPTLPDKNAPVGMGEFKSAVNGFEEWFARYSDNFLRHQECDEQIKKTTLAAEKNLTFLNEYCKDQSFGFTDQSLGFAKPLMMKNFFNKPDTVTDNQPHKQLHEESTREKIENILQKFNSIISENKILPNVKKQEKAEKNKEEDKQYAVEHVGVENPNRGVARGARLR